MKTEYDSRIEQKIKEFDSMPKTECYHDNEIRFDIHSLEDSNFKKMVLYLDDITMSPMEFLITTVLTALSGAVGKFVYWQFTESFRLYLNIWSVLCGASTISKKSSAIQMGLHDLFRIDQLFRNDYKKQKENYDSDIKGKAGKDVSEIPKPKRNYLILPNDVTMESLSDILSNANRGLMWQSEFGGFLAQLGRSYSQDAKMVLTDIYDVPHFKEISRATKGNVFIERPCFSMVGASTLEWIKSNSSKDDLRTGFFARILFSIRNTNEKKFISVFDLGQLTYKSKYYFDTRSIYDFLTGIDAEQVLTATEGAIKIFKKYELESHEELTKLIESPDEISFKGRLIYYTLKIAALMALAEQRYEVHETDMRNAICLAGYYKRNIEKLIQDELVTKSEFALKEERILIKIKNAGTISRVDLLQSNIASGKKELDPILDNLIEKEQIELISLKRTTGRASRSYRFKVRNV
ncbi:MAG: hypothetical protein A2499_15330 [Stygiobacter sp. RIFOXYC12_FULL_38_8]|nr:MAG: hypothetical protein A2X62_13845 [Stygiobacter sp. GWC2_38_9]OGV09885.1 MAG: hypothetical protein A2237_07845 [Stygiobacter sp. RIFOXYA2_FULL_38_8]OGV15380.1 MAG: hypothetical protein A2440_08065 [Stygiobacter sp. RIFOXYC2_FULL_38_25]OGV27776.1 MAG: hypothetical protein A2499_15330 [Stygiobacter sp. RIFOXYC12_FULL_38_8]OGV79118.1 MAG: hypothetical protein A2X65_08515 [Stygiobacter sp. GWF2_38_21]